MHKHDVLPGGDDGPAVFAYQQLFLLVFHIAFPVEGGEVIDLIGEHHAFSCDTMVGALATEQTFIVVPSDNTHPAFAVVFVSDGQRRAYIGSCFATHTILIIYHGLTAKAFEGHMFLPGEGGGIGRCDQ